MSGAIVSTYNKLFYPSEKNEKIDSTPVNRILLKNRIVTKWERLLETYKNQINHSENKMELYISEDRTTNSYFQEYFAEYLFISITRLNDQLDTLQLKYKDLSIVVDINQLKEDVINSLIQELLNISIRTLIQDLHEMRENGELRGNDSVQRFQFYSSKVLTSKVKKLELLKNYPVLTRIMLNKIITHIDCVIELLDRFMQDREQLLETFHLHNNSKLLSISPQLGDPHNGGKAVVCLDFGLGNKIMYKPRPLSVDLHFQQFLQWVNNKSTSLHFKVLTVLAKEQYGWQEYVEYKPCKSNDELSEFYRRQGGLIAILYLFNAADFHYENIVAHGDHPVLIDLEGLIQNQSTIISQNFSAYEIALNKLNRSVISTGMLPVSYIKSNVYNHDMSGLGGEAGQATGYMSFVLKNVGTDQMNIVKTEIFSEASKNKAYIEGMEIKETSYFLNEIIEGFTAIYNLFLEQKKFLVSTNGPLYSFNGDRIRVILRSTQIYATFLEASYHPDYLDSGYSRERLINFLWLGIKSRPDFKDAIEFECFDLLNGDIPYFFSYVNSTDLYHSNGKVTAQYFDRSNFESLLEKANSLCEKDMQEQINFLKSSLVIQETNKSKLHSPYVDNIYIPRKHQDKYNPDQFLTIADSIGGHLTKKAIFGKENDVIWNGINVDTDEQFKFSPLESSLYDGLLGIGLFYAHLYNVMKKEEYKVLAEKTLKTALDMLVATDKMSISTFHGYGSYVYVLGNYSFLFNHPSYLSEAKNILTKAMNELKEDELLDFLGGAAGLIIVSIHLYKNTGDDFFLDIAKHCGEHLLLKSESQKYGIAWRSSQLETPITGLSHGSSGFTWAILALSHFIKKSRYKEAYLAALEFENSLLPTEAENGISNWCHGFSGIGMSRIMMSQYLDDRNLSNFVDVAVKKTIENGFGYSHCLCHGDLGNLDLLLLAARQNNSDILFDKAMKIGTDVSANVTIDSLIYGTPFGVESLGLMLGQAGIGYGFLRLADPEGVPSVLTLQFPK